MNKHMASILCLLLSVTLCSANDLETYKATYDKQMETIVLAHGMNIQQLGQDYTKALDALLGKVKAAGDLDKTKAVMAETERFGKENNMPDQLSAILDIKDVQLAYQAKQASLNADKATKIINLTTQYDQALEKLQKGFVSAGKLDDAEAAQAERKLLLSAEPLTTAKALLDSLTKKPASATLTPTEEPVVKGTILPIVGVWIVGYDNGSRRKYDFTVEGTVVMTSGESSLSGHYKKETSGILVDGFGDEKIELWKKKSATEWNVLHFNPRESYPKGKPAATGVARKQ